MTPLYRAAKYGHLEIIELLISEGAKVNSRDDVSVHNFVNTMIGIALQICTHMFCVRTWVAPLII